MWLEMLLTFIILCLGSCTESLDSCLFFNVMAVFQFNYIADD